MQRRILLVDDEKFIRKGLKAIIERADTDFKDISEATDGAEALRKLREERYDAVLLDIRMPNMNGIDFMKEIQTLKFKPRVIILSGYDDFNYAVESIRFGVKQYLLKPVKREELIEALKSIEADIEIDESASYARERVSVMLDQFRINELNYIFINENIEKKQILNTLDAIGLDVLSREYCIAVMAKNGLNAHSQFEDHNMHTKVYIDMYFKNTQKNAVSFLDVRDNVVIIAGREANFEELIDYFKQNYDGEYVLGLSEPCCEPANIREAYLQAWEALKYSLLRLPGEIIRYRDTVQLKADFKIPVDLIKKIPEMAGTSRAKEIEEILDGIFDIETLKLYRIGYLEGLVESLNRYVVRYFTENLPEKANLLEGRYGNIKDVYSVSHVGDYLYLLKSYIFEINEFLLKLRNEYKDKNEIHSAIQYIRDNYYKDLTMSMVANHISLNYSYFSYVFKENTGLSFVDFLKKIRIDKARELLKNTDRKIYEISEMVGYQNPKYFTKTFRAIVGISPEQYRHKHI